MNMTSAHRQEFCVRWNSHLGSIGAAFPQLLAGQRFVDVTLACEGHQVHCHRLVLAACSTYFESILSENPCKHPVIILPSEIKLWEIQALVDFMYKGEVNVTQAGLPQLLRCAEQLRIRGLYGSDAALNLNQLRALSQKVLVPTNHTNVIGGVASLGTITGSNHNLTGLTTQTDGVDEDDTATSSTITSQINHQQQPHLQQQQEQQNTILPTVNTGSVISEQFIKREPLALNSNHTNMNVIDKIDHKLTQLHQQQVTSTIQQQRQILNSVGLSAMTTLNTVAAVPNTNTAVVPASNVNSGDDDDEEDSGDDSNSHVYEQYEQMVKGNKTQKTPCLPNALTQLSQLKQEKQPQRQSMDTGVDEDHNYVAHEEDDSYCDDGRGLSGGTINEQDTTSLSQNLMEGPNGSKRVRRSEASLAQAAKLVSKGQTFQTVSNIFNIPVSTIRFYMARKGILPKRKRGRGASSNLGVGVNISRTGTVVSAAPTVSTLASTSISASNVATIMTHTLEQIKGNMPANSDNIMANTASPTTSTTLSHISTADTSYNNINYKLEPDTTHMI